MNKDVLKNKLKIIKIIEGYFKIEDLPTHEILFSSLAVLLTIPKPPASGCARRRADEIVFLWVYPTNKFFMQISIKRHVVDIRFSTYISVPCHLSFISIKEATTFLLSACKDRSHVICQAMNNS